MVLSVTHPRGLAEMLRGGEGISNGLAIGTTVGGESATAFAVLGDHHAGIPTFFEEVDECGGRGVTLRVFRKSDIVRFHFTCVIAFLAFSPDGDPVIIPRFVRCVAVTIQANICLSKFVLQCFGDNNSLAFFGHVFVLLVGSPYRGLDVWQLYYGGRYCRRYVSTTLAATVQVARMQQVSPATCRQLNRSMRPQCDDRECGDE